MINEPLTSSSHWRIPANDRAAGRAPQVAEAGRTLRTAAAQLGAQARPAAYVAAHVVFAGLLIGGVLVAPVLATLALVCLFAPPLASLRPLAPALISVSLVWLALAILGAHMQVEHRVGEHNPQRLR